MAHYMCMFLEFTERGHTARIYIWGILFCSKIEFIFVHISELELNFRAYYDILTDHVKEQKLFRVNKHSPVLQGLSCEERNCRVQRDWSLSSVHTAVLAESHL
jgi:hypothetical protein